MLADFGATLPVGTRQAEGGEFSPLWAPPEQQQVGALVHPTLDVYALAATAWTLLAGHSPFEDPGDDNTIPAVVGRVHSGRLPELGRPDVPPTLVAVLRMALAPEASVRTPSALALAEALREVQTELKLTPTPLVVRDQPTDARPGPTLLARMSGPDDADPEATLPPGAAPFTWRPPRDAPTKRGIRPWVAALLVAVTVLATVGGVSAALLGGGLTLRPVTPATTAKPQDPIAAPPAPTTDVVGKLSDGRVYWTWQPTKQSDMHYAVTLRRPDREDITREVALSSLDVEAVLDATARGWSWSARTAASRRQRRAASMCRDRPAQGPGPTTYSWPMSGDDLDHARPNKLVAAIMSLFAAPRLNMQEDYQKVRRFQRLLAGPTGRYQVLDRVILADDESHEIPVRVLLPAERRHQDVLLFLHGGGWVTGDIESYTPACSALADATGRVVLSVDYRLAPEHPFPAGFDDCFRVAEVLLREPGLLDLEDASQITLIGDSAGGNLAAAVCLGLRDLGLPLPGRQVLLYPATWPDHDPQTSPFDLVRQFRTGLRLTALEVGLHDLYEPPRPASTRGSRRCWPTICRGSRPRWS